MKLFGPLRRELLPTRREFLAGAAATGVALAAERHAFGAAEAPTLQQGSMGSAQSGPGSVPFTRGVGVYPGEPHSYRGPRMVAAPAGRRNLALRKPAYHSSAYDYNLTAQLVTDGIVDTSLPMWMSCTAGERVLPKPEREVLVDHHPANMLERTGTDVLTYLEIGGAEPPTVDRVDVFLVVHQSLAPAAIQVTVSTSPDGHTWTPQGTVSGGTPLDPSIYPPDMVRGNTVLQPSVQFAAPVAPRRYRIRMTAPATTPFGDNVAWGMGQVAFYHGNERVEIGGPYHFTSAWKSAGSDEEWVYVDLLDECRIESVALHWIAPAAHGKLQLSNDAVAWHDVATISGAGAKEELTLAAPQSARYVRALLTQPATEHGYILSEMEVFGTGGRIAQAAPVLPGQHAAANNVSLAEGAWMLARGTAVQSDGPALSRTGADTAQWLPATVPGTTLASYLNAGVVQDPNFGDNQLYQSDSYFYADFWYRTEFATPRFDGGRTLLCLDGINWKADVFLNGNQVGHIDGAFVRGTFDVTEQLKPAGEANALAVLVRKNHTPGSVHQKTYETPSKNGGALGADNPTFHSSIGWDWISTMRGRNTGIWADVRLEHVAGVEVEDPLVSTVVNANRSVADVSVTLVVRNRTARAVSGQAMGKLGDVLFAKRCNVPANGEVVVTITSADSPALRMQNPKLWWPNGYGEPYLHDASVWFAPQGGTASEPLRFKAGLRQVTTTETNSTLRIFVNGRRLIARGGNWGFSESMLRFRAREYDVALQFHQQMNFNLVRNWVGQIGEDAFYEACDKYGIMIWQDFWLANPWDGPIPDDNAMFLKNGRDLVKRIRRHASIGIYCGRNEGDPPPALDAGIRALLTELHPDIHYIPSSADHVVSGHGPYRTLSAVEYFNKADVLLHSEIGAPNIPALESVEMMMPKQALWPQGLDWGLHDFTLEGAQGAQTLLALIREEYGGATNAADWIELAQFLNYDTYRAMFEAQSRDRMGVLLWMSHSCWPSFVWQTYDYYFDCTAAYFACRSACEPLHIQWNPLKDTIEVVNYSAGDRTGLTATAELLRPDGTSAWKNSTTVTSTEDSTITAFPMQYPPSLPSFHVLRLTLEGGGETVSTNTYLRGREEGDLRAMRALPSAAVTVETIAANNGLTTVITASLKNTSTVPALLTRLQVVGAQDKQRMLPVLFSDNYLTLIPGESRTITAAVRMEDTRGQKPVLALSGFNVLPMTT